ncbi:hypothetical protein K439DRAFT_389166 [Ramaria rubella]|nr:hypothetical protein K439DRAFT_389166 [Ramaria rubella]
MRRYLGANSQNENARISLSWQLLQLALQPQSYFSSKPLVSHQLMLLLLQLGWSVSASATIRYGEGWREKGIVRVDSH